MKEKRMPTTLPSPVDREEFRFVAVDVSGAAWRWVNEELVWVRVPGMASGRGRPARDTALSGGEVDEQAFAAGVTWEGSKVVAGDLRRNGCVQLGVSARVCSLADVIRSLVRDG